MIFIINDSNRLNKIVALLSINLPMRKKLPILGEVTVDIRQKNEEDITNVDVMNAKYSKIHTKMIENGTRDEMKLKQL